MKLYLLIIFILIINFSVFGQKFPATSATPPAQTKESDDTPIKVNTLLLNIPVIVSDRQGRNISGLKKDDFIITQNGEKQPIEFFSDEYAPMNVAIIVDTSGSTRLIMGDIKKAARSFLKVLRPEDKAMVVGFDERIKIWSELTSDQKILEKAINRLQIERVGSYMYDVVDEVINKKFATVKGRKVIILLTDGLVTGLRITDQQLINTLSESDTVIYPIMFWSKSIKKNSPTNWFLDYVQVMASTSAGKLYYYDDDLEAAFQSIAEEMKKQYLIGFYPQNTETGKPLDFKIKVNRENVVLRIKRTIRLKTPEPANK